MDMLQEIKFMTDNIGVIWWDMQILQELFYTGNQINHLLFTEPIMFGLMNIILASPYKTNTLQVHYSFRKIMKVILIIQTYLTWFHAKLILHPHHLVMRQLSHMKLSYLPVERKLVLIYWMMKILQYHISLIQSQIHQPVINFHHKLNEMCGS